MTSREAVFIGACLIGTALLLMFGRSCELDLKSDADVSEVLLWRAMRDGGS